MWEIQTRLLARLTRPISTEIRLHYQFTGAKGLAVPRRTTCFQGARAAQEVRARHAWRSLSCPTSRAPLQPSTGTHWAPVAPVAPAHGWPSTHRTARHGHRSEHHLLSRRFAWNASNISRSQFLPACFSVNQYSPAGPRASSLTGFIPGAAGTLRQVGQFLLLFPVLLPLFKRDLRKMTSSRCYTFPTYKTDLVLLIWGEQGKASYLPKSLNLLRCKMQQMHRMMTADLPSVSKAC